MARNPYIKVYVNGELLRKFGGTRSKVRDCKLEYDRMTRAQFVEKHPNLVAYIDKKPCMIRTEYWKPKARWPRQVNKHRA